MSEPGGLSFVPLGVGDAFSARYYSSCLLVEHAGTRLLIDCPHPIRKMLREAGQTSGRARDIADVSAVLLTHLHADHASGLEGFAYFSRFLLGQRATLYAHPLVTERLWGSSLAAGMEQLMDAAGACHAMKVEDYLDLRPLDFERTTDIGPFRVQCRRTIHHIPTTAFRISAGGKTLGYSADTAFDPTLLEWLSAADLVVHETNHGIHTPYEKLAALPEPMRRQMRLIHYPDEFPLDTSIIEPLQQGRLYQV
jgi:ribonuclease BN (tRNA processing enzyme)